jgi:hypothetical protein
VRSVFGWTDEGAARLLRIPAGFMRDKTQDRVEGLALERQLEVIDVALVEEGVQLGVQQMEEFLREQGLASTPVAAASTEQKTGEEKAAGKCPFSGLFASKEVDAETKKAIAEEIVPRKSNVYVGVVDQVLNEVGVMSELAKRRDDLG